MRWIAAACVVVSFLGCKGKVSTEKKNESPPVASAAPAVSAPVAAKTAPPDVDEASLAKFNCASLASKIPTCARLLEFQSAAEWNDVPAKPALYVGISTGLGGKGDGRQELVYVPMKPGPLGGLRTVVAPNDAKGKKVTEDFKALVKASQAGSRAPSAELVAAIEKLPLAAPLEPLVKTAGASYAFMKEFSYVRKKGDHLILVQFDKDKMLGGSEATMAKAWVTELYLVR
jgi:hypothetical protein